MRPGRDPGGEDEAQDCQQQLRAGTDLSPGEAQQSQVEEAGQNSPLEDGKDGEDSEEAKQHQG